MVGSIFLLFILRSPDISVILISEPIVTLNSRQKLNPIGWIWIGMVNNTSASLSVGKRLLPTSNTKLFPPTISPSVVPSPRAVVTVKYKVNLTKERSSLSELLDELQPGEKVVILKVEPVTKLSQNSPYITLRAQVRKCNQTCNQ